jgi:hypothetical protein
MAVSVRDTKLKPELQLAVAATEKKADKIENPPIKVYYTGKGDFRLDWSNDSTGKRVYFTRKAAIRDGDKEYTNLVKYNNGNQFGELKLSHTSPIVVINRKETKIIEALKNSPHCQKNTTKRGFGVFFRIEDPLETEKGKSFALEASTKAMSFVLWLMSSGEWKTVADVIGIKTHDAGAKQTIFNMGSTNPLELLKYGKQLSDHDWEIHPIFQLKAMLRKAIQLRVVEQGQGNILVFNQEKVGNDFESAIMALMDESERSSARSYMVPLIKEKIQDAIASK